MHRVRPMGTGMLRRAGCSITISVLLSVFSLYPKVTLAECLWPDFPDEPLSDGDTVTCTGITGTFVSNSTGVMVNVMSGAVVNALQLGPANHVRNFGEVHTMLFLGSDFTADNFGTMTNAANASEYTPGGAILTYVNGPGMINNGVFMPDPYDPAVSVGQINTSGDYMAGIFVRDPTAHIDISNDMAYGFEPVLDPDTGEQVVDDQGNPVYEEVIHQGSITTSGIGAHGIYIVNDEAPGSVGISNDGFIETQGPESAGIFVAPLYDEIPLYQEVLVDNGEVGSIVTNGQDAQGILVYAGDVQILNSGVIETGEADSAGIEAIGLASTSIINWSGGRISTQGLTFSPGIAAGGHRPLAGSTVQNNGNIATIGADSPGIVVLGSEYGDNHIVTSTCGDGVSCSITTTGDGSAGIQLGLVLDLGDPAIDIEAPSTGGEVNNGGIISTQGFFAPGIETLGTSNEVYNLPDGSIATIGDGSPGIQLNGTLSVGTNFGDIETHGMASPGIMVIGQGGQVDNLGIIETHGAGSSGISGSGGNSISINHTSGFIQTSGSDAHGVKVEGDDSFIDNYASIYTTGSDAHDIYVYGDSAWLTNQSGAAISTEQGMGILAIGNDAHVSNNGSITSGLDPGAENADGIHVGGGIVGSYLTNNMYIDTYGADSDGIFVSGYAGTSVISNTGVITTADSDAEGIELSGLAAYTVTNAGSIATSGNSADGIGVIRSSLSGGAVVTNTGDIVVTGSGSSAIRVAAQAGDSTTVINTASGSLTSPDYAINGGLGDETVHNSGIINGDVYLDAGDDTFVHGANSTVNGDVYGGTEVEHDTLEFALAGNESISGLQYIGFEVLAFSGTGNLSLIDELYTETAYFTSGTTFTLSPGSELIVTTAAIEDGGTLAGNGNVTGSVQANGGTLAIGESIGAMTISGDLSLNGGVFEFEANSLSDKDELLVGGDATLSDGFINIYLGFTPAPEDILEFLVVQGTLDILDGFDGIRGIAAAGSDVPLGTQFTVALGEELYQGTVSSAVPIQPSVWLFCSGLLGLVGIARRKKQHNSYN